MISSNSFYILMFIFINSNKLSGENFSPNECLCHSRNVQQYSNRPFNHFKKCSHHKQKRHHKFENSVSIFDQIIIDQENQKFGTNINLINNAYEYIPSCQPPLSCNSTFELIDGICRCPSNEIEVNEKCERLISCNEGTPILTPPDCNMNCVQSCSCDPPLVFIGGVCTCPTDQILINGACETKINCENGSPIIIPSNYTNNCKQSCQCDDNFLLINGECQSKIFCVNGFPVPEPENCTDDCEFQVCQCGEGFDNVNGNCVCNKNEIATVNGNSICRCKVGTYWNGEVCYADCPPNSNYVQVECEYACIDGSVICVPILEDQICFCSPGYVRYNLSCVVMTICLSE